MVSLNLKGILLNQPTWHCQLQLVLQQAHDRIFASGPLCGGAPGYFFLQNWSNRSRVLLHLQASSRSS